MKADGKSPVKKNNGQNNSPDYALRKIEIVAPGGQPESLKAAIFYAGEQIFKLFKVSFFFEVINETIGIEGNNAMIV